MAGVPELASLYPAGGQPGTQFAVTAGGKLDPWPVGVWVDDPGIRFTPGDTHGQFRVTITPQAQRGARLVRVYTPQGASALRLFVVGTEPERTWEPIAPSQENKPTPLPASIPVTFNGLFTSTSQPVVFPVDVSGECLVRARFIAGAIDSPAQGNLALLKDATTPLVRTQHPTGRDFDLRCPLPVGGVFFLEATPLADSLVGGVAVFRVQVSADPLVRLPSPVSTAAESDNVTRFRPLTAARTLAVPGLTRGVLSPAGREINYSFLTRQNEQFRFLVRGESIGSPLQPLLRLMDLDRRVLAESLSGGDAELVWTARDDAEHLLAVTDARGEGGPTYAFQIEVSPPAGQFSGRLEHDRFCLRRGESIPCPVRILCPPSFRAALLVSAVGLPAGVTAAPESVPSGTDQVRLTLRASRTAEPFNGPFQVMLMTSTESPPRIRFARFRLEPRHAGEAQLLVEESDQPWLTVLPDR